MTNIQFLGRKVVKASYSTGVTITDSNSILVVFIMQIKIEKKCVITSTKVAKMMKNGTMTQLNFL
jgi:hypothetical protein